VRPDAGQLRYTFHFGDGAHVGPQAAPTASHAYAQGVAGTYSAYVIVVDEQQRSAISPPVTVRTTVTVTVDPADPPLSAALAVRFRDDRTVVPAVVEFDASASTGPEGRLYRFDFGDGSQPRLTTEPGVTHVYTVPGTFTARVRVIDPEDAQRFSEAEAVLTIVSAQQTTAQLAVSPSRVRVGEPVTLDATASIAAPGRQITHFTFNLGDGRQVSRSVAEFGSQAGRLVVAYPVAGVYEPSVQVVDDGGTSALAKTQVQVSGHVGDGPGGPLPVTPPPTTPSPTAPPAPMPTPPLAPPTAEPSTAARSGGGGLSSGALAWLVVLAALSRRRRPAAST
jgi:hypothetical protein